ncbi:MAG: DUF177 domain-containing protein [Dehalococcoidales bacterium]|nr:DUF177 domain-containing protein [Dehalococcoidales bacterium]
MEINVAGLLHETVGAVREYELAGAEITADDITFRQVSGQLKLTRTPRGILVEGKFSGEVELICSRCLSAFRYPLTISFQEEFLPTIDINSGLPVEAPDEPGAFRIDDHHIIDVDEAIRQYALMAVPMKPLCEDSCAGLCPGCGKNLNKGTCGCPSETTDPRWAKLGELRK